MSALEARLADLAARGDTITYGALARELGLRIGVLTSALEALMEADAIAGRPFRAAVCTARLSPDALPAPGFFEKAASLGRIADDRVLFTRDQRTRLQQNRL